VQIKGPEMGCGERSRQATRRDEQDPGPGPGGLHHPQPCAPLQRRTCEARSRYAALGEHVHTPIETPPVEHRQHPCTLGICGRRAVVHSVAVARDAPSDASLAAGGRRPSRQQQRPEQLQLYEQPVRSS
jgi:hypothetical protein